MLYFTSKSLSHVFSSLNDQVSCRILECVSEIKRKLLERKDVDYWNEYFCLCLPQKRIESPIKVDDNRHWVEQRIPRRCFRHWSIDFVLYSSDALSIFRITCILWMALCCYCDVIWLNIAHLSYDDLWRW